MHPASVSVGGKTIVAGPLSQKARFEDKIQTPGGTAPRPRKTRPIPRPQDPANSTNALKVPISRISSMVLARELSSSSVQTK